MERTRTHPTAIIRYGLYLYFSSSRSFRLAAKCLSAAVTERTHVSIWKWVQKYAAIAADGFRMDRRLVKKIFVDETLFSR
jgi:transposase-like protein